MVDGHSHPHKVGLDLDPVGGALEVNLDLAQRT